jgi:hypothetical protein
MTYIPIENKISLINKYIQINILHKKDVVMHVDIPEIEILNAIVADLKEHDDMLTQPETERSLESVIDSLKAYQQKQSDMRSQINALMHTLQNLSEEDPEQISLDEIIRNLKEMDQS